MTLLPERRVRDELDKLRNLIEKQEYFSTLSPTNSLEASCLPIAQAHLRLAIARQVAYLLKWKVDIDYDSLHGRG